MRQLPGGCPGMHAQWVGRLWRTRTSWAPRRGCHTWILGPELQSSERKGSGSEPGGSSRLQWYGWQAWTTASSPCAPVSLSSREGGAPCHALTFQRPHSSTQHIETPPPRPKAQGMKKLHCMYWCLYLRPAGGAHGSMPASNPRGQPNMAQWERGCPPAVPPWFRLQPPAPIPCFSLVHNLHPSRRTRSATGGGLDCGPHMALP